MIENISSLLPYLVLFSHILWVVLFFSIIFRNSWGKDIVDWLGKRSTIVAFLIVVAAITGSLFYSEIVGYEPCVLCWWQRVFLFPLVIIFGVALWKQTNSVFSYAVPMVLIAGLIALYHSYVYLGGASLLPCTALGGACSKIYVFAFGYITIPSMSLTISLYILLLAWAHRIYNENNSHS